MLEKLANKIFLIIGRGIVKAIKNENKIMKIQISGLNGETGTDIEYPQNYGFASYPDNADDLESVLAFIGGNRDQGIALIVHDRSNKPSDLLKGESRLYAKGGTKVTCKTNGDLELNGNGDFAVAFNDLKIGFDQLKTDFSTFVTTIYNLHVHTETGATTLVPVPTGSASTASIDNAKVNTVKLP